VATFKSNTPDHHINTGAIEIQFKHGLYATADKDEIKLLDANDFVCRVEDAAVEKPPTPHPKPPKVDKKGGSK